MAKQMEIEPVPVGGVSRKTAEGIGRGAAEGKQPPHGTQRPTGNGQVPRVVNPLERADPKSGLARFKISARNYQEHCPIRYVLAKTADEATAFYRRDTKIDEVRAKIRGKRTEEADDVELVTVALED